jgi:hypothetical protein
MRASVPQALSFIAEAELPSVKVSRAELTHRSGAGVLGAATMQSAIVGSEIISFANGVTPEHRQALANSSLLAQLVAKKAIPEPSKIYEWYDAYFDALSNLGWMIQERELTVHDESSNDFYAHQAILAVAATLLAGAPASLELIRTTLDALRSMDTSSPWITLFNRESQSAKSAKFQVGLASNDQNGQLTVAMMAFGLEATSTITQLLLFKAKTNSVTLRRYKGQVAINTEVLDAIRGALHDKVLAHSQDYIRALPPL